MLAIAGGNSAGWNKMQCKRSMCISKHVAGTVFAGTILALSCFVTSQRTATADEQTYFKILSQNTYNLGRYENKEKKYEGLKNRIAEADMTMLQEVRRTANLSKVLPKNYKFRYKAGLQVLEDEVNGIYDLNLKGFNTHKEAYVSVYNPERVQILCYIDTKAINAWRPITGNMARPPDLALVQFTKDQGQTYESPIWLMNFHAIFGKRVQGRREEAAAVDQLVAEIQRTQFTTGEQDFECVVFQPEGDQSVSALGDTTTFPIIVAGDWNLSKDKVVSSAPAWQARSVLVEGKTTVNKTGCRVSPYDHFATSGTSNEFVVNIFGSKGSLDADVDNSDSRYDCPENDKRFRADVSDHFGILYKIRHD